MKEMSEELTNLLMGVTTTRYHNHALLYMRKQTFEDIKFTLVRDDTPIESWRHDPIASMFGIPIMLYHAIEYGRWELVERGTGTYITSGNVWKGESSARTGKRHVVDQFAAAAIGAIEENMKGTDGGYPDGCSASMVIVARLADQFAQARQKQDHFSDCCFNPFSPHYQVNHQ